MADGITVPDGSYAFDGGVDSNKPSTLANAANPNGLQRNQLSWLDNGTVREAGISPRDGWLQKGTIVGPNSLPYLLGKSYQGHSFYKPDVGTPYILAVVGGHVLKVDPDFIAAPIDLSIIYGVQFTYPGTPPKCYFAQAENYLVIQAGDFTFETATGQLPLIWDGSTLVRSNGLTGIAAGWEKPVEYAVAAGTPWVVPAVGNSVVIAGGAPYGGNLNDQTNLYATVGLLSFLIGQVRVTGIAGNNTTILVNSLSGNNFGTAGTTISQAMVFVLTSGYSSSSLTLSGPGAILDMGTCTSAVGNTWNFAGGVSFPPANGDTILVLAISGAGIQVYGLEYISVAHVTSTTATTIVLSSGQLVLGGGDSLRISTTLATTGGGLTNLVPAVGSNITLHYSGLYPGSVGDTISLSGASVSGGSLDTNVNFGTFTVVSFSANTMVLTTLTTSVAGYVLLPGYPVTFGMISAPTTGTGLVNQIPAATAMIYYMGRLWYSQGNVVAAGDIVGDTTSGTILNDYRDAVLCVTENPLAFGGDGFTMPLQSGDITGLAVPQMINASLGQGLLTIGTPNAIFQLQVPVTRTDWIAATANNQPQIFVVQINNGFVNDWSAVSVNGDVWFQSLAPDIRSLLTAVRYFQQWGNVSLSSNEQYILSKVNASLLTWASGIYFNNRLLMTSLPKQTAFGVVHSAVIPLDMQPISTLETQLPPNWEGAWEGLQILQLTTAAFNSLQRAFAATLSSQTTGEIDLYENIPGMVGDTSGGSNNRIEWQATLPAFATDKIFNLKKLAAGEIWLDKIQGAVDIHVEYQPDSASCWTEWCKFRVCTARSSLDLVPAESYPTVLFQEGFRETLTLPRPQEKCEGQTGRPSNQGYQFSPRLTIKGQCRIRGFVLHFEPMERKLYQNNICSP